MNGKNKPFCCEKCTTEKCALQHGHGRTAGNDTTIKKHKEQRQCGLKELRALTGKRNTAVCVCVCVCSTKGKHIDELMPNPTKY